MYLVGIIDFNDNKINIGNLLKNIKKCIIHKINLKNINNYKNIRFNVLVINDNLERVKNNEELERIIENSRIILLNIDYKENIDFLKHSKALEVVTYGFNQKATVTIVSFDEGNITLDFQRKIISLNNEVIEEKEITEMYNNRAKTGCIFLLE